MSDIDYFFGMLRKSLLGVTASYFHTKQLEVLRPATEHRTLRPCTFKSDATSMTESFDRYVLKDLRAGDVQVLCWLLEELPWRRIEAIMAGRVTIVGAARVTV